jgi:FkbM family methyltransferase
MVVRMSPLIEPEAFCYRYYPQYVSPEDTVVEAGVYLGGGTRLLARLAKQVYSFEPHPLNFKVAKALLSKGGISNAKLFNFALGSHDGTADLNTQSGGESNFAASSVGVVGNEYNSTVRVKVRRLDSLDIRPDVLVVDAEGSELEIIEGGGRALDGLKAAIVETHRLASGHTLSQVERWARGRFSDIQIVDPASEIPLVMAKKPLRA